MREVALALALAVAAGALAAIAVRGPAEPERPLRNPLAADERARALPEPRSTSQTCRLCGGRLSLSGDCPRCIASRGASGSANSSPRADGDC